MGESARAAVSLIHAASTIRPAPAPLNVTGFVRNFAEYINRVAYRGERYVLIRGGREVAALHLVPEGRALERFPLLPIDLPTARAHARLWANLTAADRPIGPPHDQWLAATCLASV